MRLGHVAVVANDPDGLADFYTGFLGLQKLGQVVTEETGQMILLSSGQRPGCGA